MGRSWRPLWQHGCCEIGKALTGFVQKGGRDREIHRRRRGVDVPQEGGEVEQARAGIQATLIPVEQGAHGKGMPLMPGPA